MTYQSTILSAEEVQTEMRLFEAEHMGGIKRTKHKTDHSHYTGEGDYIENAFIDAYKDASDTGMPLVIMDEPEQSLDAVAELQLWIAISNAKTQVIVATHSLFPFLRPDDFNIIEAVPGYCTVAQSALNSTVGTLKT
jgi:predicted ATP-dependent endonuclease of OLD family